MDRVYIGKVSHKQGERFEQRIKNACKIYQINEIAEINKANEPMKPISKQQRGGWFKAVFTEKSGADFSGVVKGGRAVFFEAKYTDSEKMLKSRVTELQIKQLQNVNNLGGIAFVLISFSSGRVYRIPIDKWVNMKSVFGRLFLRESDCEQFLISEEYERIDFLKGVVFDGITKTETEID